MLPMKKINNDFYTKKQRRIENRKKTLLELAGLDLVYCAYHNKSLRIDEINKHYCYTGNNGNTICTSLRIQCLSGEYLPYKQWASNHEVSTRLNNHL